MKSAIVYYSYSGNTKRLSEKLAGFLGRRGSVDVIPLIALDESERFVEQARRAFFRTEANIAPVNYDMSKYDLVCLGTPVWAFGPAPAMNSFLKFCHGFNGKKLIVFTTYGSGVGNGRCLRHMAKMVRDKGAQTVVRFSVQQNNIEDENQLIGIFKKHF